LSVKFKTIQRGQPGIVGGGEKKFYASAISNGEVSLKGLTKTIEKMSTVSGADIRAVLYALVDAGADILSDGRILRLGDLGSLRVSLSSSGKATEDEINSGCIKDACVIFTPGSKIKTMLATVKFEKV
jgi:predicted histone-like DNA-binding protein